MARRSLRVDMQALLDALDLHAGDWDSYLDTESGEVLMWSDPAVTGEEPEFDPDDQRYQFIPSRESRDDYRFMERFAASVEEADVRLQLQRALEGSGAFRRFRDTLQSFPDLRARYEAERQRALLAEAVAWLEGLGIEPVYEALRPIEQRQSPGAKPSGSTPVGLFDLLLLGAPEGKTELLNGRVSRVFVARDTARARKVFTALARELCERHGLGWRKKLVEGRDTYEVERFHLSVCDRVVQLDVEVSRALWDAFSGT